MDAEKLEQLKQRFIYQKPSNDHVVKLHGEVADKTLALAIWIEDNVPDSRGKSLAMTKLEEARMWANQAIAMEQPNAPDGE